MNIEHRHGQVVAGHLGGYVPGGDPNTTYPILWRWLVENLGVRSVLDVGCGDGLGALAYFHDTLGIEAQGIDGIPPEQPNPWIWVHDYATGPLGPTSRDDDGWDLVWSAEFVEHVEERYVPNFLADFARAPLVLMTHAIPGQGGHHHVNCRTGDYWIGALAAIGYRLDPGLTETTRALAVSPGSYSYYAATGLAFRRD